MVYSRIIIFILLSIFLIIPGQAQITDGACTGNMVLVGSTCQATGFLNETGGTTTESAVFKVEAVDCSIPSDKQAEIKFFGFWNPYGTYMFDVIIHQGVPHYFLNPDDTEDYAKLTIDAIFCEGDTPAAHFQQVNYQQTFHLSSGGSDSNTGTQTSTAWKKLAHASSKLIDGTDLLIESGTNSGQSVAYTAYPGVLNSPIIYRGNGKIISNLTYSDTSEYGIQLTDSARNYIYFNDFSIRCNCNLGVIDTNFGSNNIFNNMDIQGYILFSGTNILSNSNVDEQAGQYTLNIQGGSPEINDTTFNIQNSGFRFKSAGIFFHNNLISSYSFQNAEQGTLNNNYWLSYTGIDANHNGYGDTPFVIGSLSDSNPLMDVESGYVKNTTGVPIFGAIVKQESAPYRNTTTDINGSYELSTIGRDNVSLNASKEGDGFDVESFFYNSYNANFTLNYTVPSELGLFNAYGNVQYINISESNFPQDLENAYVSINSTLYDYTDASGNYEINNITNGTYIIYATKTGFDNVSHSVSNTSNVVNFLLHQNSTNFSMTTPYIEGSLIKSVYSPDVNLWNSPYFVWGYYNYSGTIKKSACSYLGSNIFGCTLAPGSYSFNMSYSDYNSYVNHGGLLYYTTSININTDTGVIIGGNYKMNVSTRESDTKNNLWTYLFIMVLVFIGIYILSFGDKRRISKKKIYER